MNNTNQFTVFPCSDSKFITINRIMMTMKTINKRIRFLQFKRDGDYFTQRAYTSTFGKWYSVS